MGFSKVRKGDTAIVYRGKDKGHAMKVVDIDDFDGNHVKLSNGEWYHQDDVSGTRDKPTK